MAERARDAGAVRRSRGQARDFDIVLFGASGFTGILVADYLSAHLSPEARWAIAGRNRESLEAVAGRLARSAPRAAAPEILVADVSDPRAVAEIAPRARVVASTIGPFLEHGGVLVALCAAHGTDYVDLCGEPEFVDRVYLEQHALAEATGARLVHACGFEAIPHDLGVFFTMRHVPENVALSLTGALEVDARFSSGTIESAFGQFRRQKEQRETAARRRRLEPAPVGRRVRYVRGFPHFADSLKRWLVPLPGIEPQIVVRSAARMEQYGPDFSFSNFAAVDNFATVATGLAGVGSIFLAAQVPVALAASERVGALLRRGRIIDHHDGPSPELKARLRAGTAGPDALRRARSSFELTILAEGGGRVVVTRVSGGDPGYTETSKMLAESAMCLAFDDNPERAGQLTPAEAMGDALLERLQAAGIRFELLQS